MPNPEDESPEIQGPFGLNIGDLLQRLSGGHRKEPQYKHFTVLSADEVKMYNELESETDDLLKRRSKLETKRRHFHTGLQLKYDAADKELRFNKELSSLEVLCDD